MAVAAWPLGEEDGGLAVRDFGVEQTQPIYKHHLTMGREGARDRREGGGDCGDGQPRLPLLMLLRGGGAQLPLHPPPAARALATAVRVFAASFRHLWPSGEKTRSTFSLAKRCKTWTDQIDSMHA